MKIQELAIIFIIIILPISLLISEYTQFQIETIKLQTEYDARLTSATYDAIRAFQLNAINSTTSDLANSKMRDLEASVNSFRNSIMSAFDFKGHTEDVLNEYIPALVYTLYDGFYIYSPYNNIVDEDGAILENKNEHESIYGLKPYISYSCRYVKGTTDVVITYTLDNYITVQGTVSGEYVNKSGYLIDNVFAGIIGEFGNEKYSVTYNGVEIKSEQLKEYLPISGVAPKEYPYAKINGTKYYLIEDYLTEEDLSGATTSKDCVIYISNNKPIIQYKEGSEQFIAWRNMIINNQSAIRYYRDASTFTEWFKGTVLPELTYGNAIDEVISEDGTIEITNLWPEDERTIFDFNTPTGDISNNIENELSEFNQHRLAVIRHKIETNLSIAISNYNSYSGVSDNVFQMPELKEDEWEQLTHNISLISFLQGLPIGGKIYNGYSIVTNTESKEVVTEESIYILGKDTTNNKYNYYKIGDKGLETGGNIEICSSDYAKDYGVDGKAISAGRINTDFKKASILNSDNITISYYYPLKDYNASYDSVVMQNNVTTYDDIYQYVSGQSDELKTAFYTALGRERYGAYKSTNTAIEYYSVLVVGTMSSGTTASPDDYMKKTYEIFEELSENRQFEVTFKFDRGQGAPERLGAYINEQKGNYNLIIVNSFVWPIEIDERIISQTSNVTNLITIGNDICNLEIFKSGSSGSNCWINPINREDEGTKALGDIELDPITSDTQAHFKFRDDVKVFFTGEYHGEVEGEYDLIGVLEKGENRWVHSQVALGARNNKKDMKLLKELIKYALNIK